MRHLITDYTHNDLLVGRSSPYHTDEDINMMEDELQRRVDEINNDFDMIPISIRHWSYNK